MKIPTICCTPPISALSFFQIVWAEKGEKQKNIHITKNTIIFLLEGELEFCCNQHVNKQLLGEECVFFPPASMVSIKAIENVHLIAFSFSTQVQLCENFRLDSLLPFCDEKEIGCYPLTLHKRVKEFLSVIELYLKDGLSHPGFLDLKKQEFFFILKKHYEKHQLAKFFSPIITKDLLFNEFILNNYLLENSVEELSELIV